MMGEPSNTRDIQRFHRSEGGQTRLNEYATMHKIRTVTDVSFANETSWLPTILHLAGGSFMVFEPSLERTFMRIERADVLKQARDRAGRQLQP